MSDDENRNSEASYPGVTRPANWFLPNDTPERDEPAAAPGGYPGGSGR